MCNPAVDTTDGAFGEESTRECESSFGNDARKVEAYGWEESQGFFDDCL